MHYASAALLLGTSLFASTVAAATPPPILAGSPTAQQIDQRCDYWVAESSRLRTALEKEAGPATVAKTLLTYDRLYEVLFNGSLESTLYREVSISPESRTAGEKCEVRIASEGNKLSLSRPTYDRLKAIKVPDKDVETKLLLNRALGGFERAGVALDPAGRAKAQALSDEISQLSTTFEANIPKDQRKVTATPAELDGLPQDFLDAHKPGPDGKITLTTDYPDYVPVMTYAKSSDLRHRFHREYNQRAYPTNDAILRDLINKRDELAKLVGRPNYATLNFEDRMLNTPAKVQALIDEMATAARPAGQRDYAKKLAVLQQLQPGATKIEPWDGAFLNPIVQKQSYGFDRQDVRDVHGVRRTVAAVEASLGPLSLVVNNAAGNFVRPAEALPEKAFATVVDIVLNGTFHVTRAAARSMISRGTGGAVLNVVATYAWTGGPGTVHSAAAKAGVLAMTRTLAVEWARHGIRVVAIAPGAFDSAGASDRLWPSAELENRVRAAVPLGRFARREEVAEAAAWLLSDAASYVTGECLTIDGGAWLGRGILGAGEPIPKVRRRRRPEEEAE